MKRTRRWDNNDRLWVEMMPFLFSPERWQAAAESCDALVKMLGLSPGASVLDLCCGPGRFVLPLAERGFRVTGVDRTRAYLKTARNLARSQKLDVELVIGDMRRFLRPRAFDAAISTFSSFGYFQDPADDLKAARNTFLSLRRGGAFLVETMSKEVLARVYAPRGWRESDGVFLLEERTVAEDWSGLHQRWVLVRRGRTQEYRVYMRLYSAVELRELLRRAGFRRVRMYGGFRREPYDNSAKRLVAVATKG